MSIKYLQALLVTLACVAPWPTLAAAPQESAVSDWIRAHAIPLSTTEAGHGFDDLQPLKPLIGDARLVSVGEATHGSREIFQLKHRVLEFLASEMGFSLLAIEASMADAGQLNEYVLRGTGDPAVLLRRISPFPWDTEEVLAKIRWMRTFNQSGRGHLEFAGIDMQMPARAEQAVAEFVARSSPDLSEIARGLIDDTNIAIRENSEGVAGVARASIAAASAAGTTVRFTGSIRTEGVTRGYAGLWWRVDGASGVLALNNMEGRGATGTSDWATYAIEIPVDASARDLSFGVLLTGNGTAWFDSLKVDAGGRPFTEARVFDFDFEQTPSGALSLGGYGYEARMVSDQAHTGARSLRIQCRATETCGVAQSPAALADRWTASLLEASRVRARALGLTDRDVDWAIQCTRLMRQRLQVMAGQTSRDRSMAENVTWLLDQHPGARMMIWAHNQHVATGGFRPPLMGAFLRRTYGSQMFVIGTAFNQGAFASPPMRPAMGWAKAFDVPPAPPGSLDAALAAVRMPLFALDLRQAPAWFRQPRASRDIGAGYPEGEPYAFMTTFVAPDAFDALLFIDRTTAARQNARLQ